MSLLLPVPFGRWQATRSLPAGIAVSGVSAVELEVFAVRGMSFRWAGMVPGVQGFFLGKVPFTGRNLPYKEVMDFPVIIMPIGDFIILWGRMGVPFTRTAAGVSVVMGDVITMQGVSPFLVVWSFPLVKATGVLGMVVRSTRGIGTVVHILGVLIEDKYK